MTQKFGARPAAAAFVRHRPLLPVHRFPAMLYGPGKYWSSWFTHVALVNCVDEYAAGSLAFAAPAKCARKIGRGEVPAPAPKCANVPPRPAITLARRFCCASLN